MRLRMLFVPAVLLVIALPAQARAGGFSGIVVAKQPQHGTLLLAGPHGIGVTIRGGVAPASVGERIAVQGVRLHDGTIRVSRLRVLARVGTADLRGTVLREVAAGTLVASGRTIVMIDGSSRRLAAAKDHGGLESGDVAQFRVRFDHDSLVEAQPPATIGQAGTARIEGTIVSLSPFVVAAEGLPLTIAVPAGMTLPVTLAPGQRIELTVQVGTGNTFTLIAVDEVENATPVVQAQEVELQGFVVSSTPAQIAVTANGTTFTFVAPAGTMLPVLPAGTFVEVRGISQNGTVTLTRLRVENNAGGNDGDGPRGGDGGGGDGGGGDGGAGGH